jgi:hypothetical protein
MTLLTTGLRRCAATGKRASASNAEEARDIRQPTPSFTQKKAAQKTPPFFAFRAAPIS